MQQNTKSIRRRVMDKESWTRELMVNGTQERTKERQVEEGRTVCTLSVGKVQLGRQASKRQGIVQNCSVSSRSSTVKVSLRQGKLDLASGFDG